MEFKEEDGCIPKMENIHQRVVTCGYFKTLLRRVGVDGFGIELLCPNMLS